MKKVDLKSLVLNTTKNPLFAGSALMFAGSMLVNVINYVYHLIMGRVLGPVDYGVLASVFSLLYIVSIVPLSTSVSIVKFVSSAKDKKELSSVYFGIRNFVFRLSTVLLILFVFLSLPIARFLHIGDVKTVFLVGPVMFFSIITLVNQATAQGLLKFGGYIMPNLTSAISKLVVGLVLVFLGWSVFGAVFGVVVAMFLAYLVSILTVDKDIKKYKNADFPIKKFVKFSIPVLAQAFAFTALFSTDVLLARHFLSSLDAGIYAALSTLGKVIYFAVSPITSAMFPIISKRHTSGENYRKVFLSSLGLTTMVSLSIVGVYFLFPKMAINALFGEKYLAGTSQLVWMGTFMLFYSISYLLVNYFISRGKTLIVIFPFMASVAQYVVIDLFFHGSILQIVQTCLIISFILVLVLLVIIYNEKNR